MDLPEGFHKEVIEARENVISNTNTIEPKVSTSPLKPGGANFKTNVLIQASPSKLIYKPSIGAAIFSFIFLAVGLGVLFYGIFPLFQDNSSSDSINWFLVIFGLIFAGAGGFMFYIFYKPRVFDKQQGLYYTSYAFKGHQSRRNQSEDYLPLQSIVAIQIIGEHVKSDDGSYKSFELNLVLDDASRRNVVDHGSLKSIINDAEMLSEFLNIPIWHAGSINNL
ncbi:hypothetical protein ADIWIN_1278 [Winogradskyella psychrotolerans RS-3]|uniref:Uncharacterized protein n=1 Tax=Winogradskyella psychrotolerans RS-3 TaxID=641526 RepID=S7VUB1_9FLAO|nr:hypothetical protein [Winogradskyella psychrotolerans]EPR73641.1 hypothetical protein ADIWIN_1278 [Winogradskyella psychrotolerans RS-3]